MPESPSPTEQGTERPSGRMPVEELAEGYLERLRRGEKPTVREYCLKYPDLADEIRETFPILAMLEDLVPDADDESGEVSHDQDVPERIGEYEIIREIGRGGMGIVYEAEHETMLRRVALKVLPAHLSTQGKNLDRFLREARAAGRLHHTNIVPVFEVGVHENVHFYAMQFIQGQNLDIVLDELRRLREEENGATARLSGTRERSAEADARSVSVARSLLSLSPPPPEAPREIEAGDLTKQRQESTEVTPASTAPAMATTRLSDSSTATRVIIPQSSDLSSVGETHDGYFRRIARIGVQVAEALDYAHSHRILHRDIKPSNLILDNAGVMWVTDFGLAKNEGDDLTHTGDIVGTLRYMAPERFRGIADARSDLFSLGLTLYELCTLQYAYDQHDRATLIDQLTHHDPPRPRRVNPDIPRDLETIVLKLIDRDHTARYQSARAVSDDLRLFISDRPILARRSTLTERCWRWCRRNPVSAGMLSCIAVLLAVILVGSLNFAWNADRQARALRRERTGLLVTQQSLQREKVLAESERRRAESETERARQAESAATAANLLSLKRLFMANYRRAQAMRWSGRPGQHFTTLMALKLAADDIPELGHPPESERLHRGLLRKQAVIAMPLMDLKKQRTWEAEDGWSNVLAFDREYRRYVHSDAEGNLVIRSIDPEEVTGSRGTNEDQVVRTINGTAGPASVAAFSHTERYLVSLHAQDLLRVYDLHEDRPTLELEAPTGTVFRLSTVGELIVVASSEGTTTVYSLVDGKEIASRTEPEQVNRVAFSPQADQVAVGTAAGLVHIWDFETDQASDIRAPASVTALTWSTRDLLVAGVSTGEVLVWDRAHTDLPPRRFQGHSRYVASVTVSEDGKLLASSAWDGTTRFRCLSSDRELMQIEGEAPIGSGFSSDGRHLAVTRADNTCSLYTVASGGPRTLLRSRRQPGRRWAVAWHPNERSLLAAANNRNVELWDIAKREPALTIECGETRSLFFSPDGEQLLTCGLQGVRRWPLKTVRNEDGTLRVEVGEPVILVDQRCRRMDVSADHSVLAVDMMNSRVTLLAAEDDFTPRILGRHPGLDHLAISPDARWLVTTAWNGTGIRVWDAATGEVVRDLTPDSEKATITFTADGKFLAASTGAGPQRVWKVEDWEPVHTFRQHHRDGWPGAIAFAPSGELASITHSRFTTTLFDPRTYGELAVIEPASRHSVEWSAFDQASSQLAIVGTEHIEIWDIQDLRERLAKLKLDWSPLVP